MAKKSKDGLRDIACARPDEIATREIRGYRVEPHNINAICVEVLSCVTFKTCLNYKLDAFKGATAGNF